MELTQQSGCTAAKVCRSHTKSAKRRLTDHPNGGVVTVKTMKGELKRPPGMTSGLGRPYSETVMSS
jgi:hypothetical protein